MNKKNNHYNILGVAENATHDEIKKAYRKLSLKYHPDKNNNSPESIEMIKMINESFSVIGNEESRIDYDNSTNGNFMRMNNSGMDINDLEGIFENIFMHNSPFAHLFGNKMNNNNSGFHIFKNGFPVNMNTFQKPPPILQSVKINIDSILTDKIIPIEVERWIMENEIKVFEKQTLYINIPKGIDDNEIIVLADKGHIMNEHIKGDIKVTINIINNTGFQRNGLDLIYEKKISLKEALCGFSFELKYINEKVYTINNNKGNIIKPNYNKVIPNMGLHRENFTGNLIIIFHVDFPEVLSLGQIDKIANIL